MRAITTQNEGLLDTVLKVVIIYDDFDAAADATALLERVALRVGKAIKWDIKPWRCDVLKQPSLAALTIAVAANADLIVLTLRRTHFPPAELLDWLKNWGKHRRIKDAAILTLHADTDSHHSKAWDDIKTLMEPYQLNFLGSHKVSAHRNSTPSVNRLQPRKHPTAPVSLPADAERLPAPQPWAVNK